MVKKIFQFLSHFVFWTAGICAVVLYTGIIPVAEKNPYSSLLPKEKLKRIEGRIAAPLSISSDGKFYSAPVEIYECSGSLIRKDSVFSASGKIKTQIASEEIQACMPGKLFSSSSNGRLIEKGAVISASGYWNEWNETFRIVKISECNYENNIKGKMNRMRALCRLYFKRLMYSWGSAGAFILSLLSGSRDYLDKDIKECFKNAGLSHILALSGMHLSFFSSLAMKGGIKLTGRKYVFYLEILAVFIFVWFAGISPSLFRALLCSVIMLAASKAGCKEINSFTVLCIVFLIHITVFPEDMFTAAFMLSYGALAGILLFSGIINSFLVKIFPSSISGSFAASSGAMIATGGISAGLFKMITPVGILSSAAVSPLVSVFLSVSIISICFCILFPSASVIFGKVLNIFYSVIKFLTEQFAKCPSIHIL